MLLQALFIISQPSVNSNWSYSPETPNLGQNQWFFFCPMWPWNLMADLAQGKSEGFDSCNWPSNHTQTGFKSSIFQPVWSWYLMDDLKNNRVPLPYYIKLYASFPLVNSNWSYSLETLNSGQNWRFFWPMWPWNLMDDLEKQQGTSSILCQAFCIISKLSVNTNWSYSLEMLNLGKNRLFFALCDLEIWQRTLKNNKTLLYGIKLCASFQSQRWIQTGVTVQKC